MNILKFYEGRKKEKASATQSQFVRRMTQDLGREPMAEEVAIEMGERGENGVPSSKPKLYYGARQALLIFKM